MTTTTQQIPSYPALDFANAVLAETDGAREIIHMLHDIATLGPAPSACPEPSRSAQPEDDAPIISDTPEPFDPYSIQQYILDITDNCRTLMTVLTDIYRAPDDDPKVKESHRVRAGRMLIDRIMAMYPTAVHSGDYPDQSPVVSKNEEEPFDKEVWDEIIAQLNQLEDEGILTPDPNAPKTDHSIYMNATDEEIDPYAAEEAAKFSAEIALRVERQKQWPEIEERRRKKLEQIYPSHSEDDGDPPDT